LAKEDKKAAEVQDKKRKENCKLGPCLSDEVIDDYHEKCFIGCGVPAGRYPGVNPPWLPFNPNKPNQPPTLIE